MIRVVEIFKTSTLAMLRHKGRTVLTMLGVIIGVFAVVSLVSLGVGVQNYMKDQFESLGATVIFVAPGKFNFADDPAKAFSNNKLDEKHIELIESYASEYAELVSPSIRAGKSIKYKANVYFSTLIGSSFTAKDIFNISMEKGRFFTRAEERSEAHVAVLGPLVAEELFFGASPIGQRIKIEENSYEVIGITTKKGQDFDDAVYVPYTTVQKDFGIKNFAGISVKARNADQIPQTISQIKLALLRDLEEDDFSVISTEDVLQSIQSVLQMLTAGIGAIAGISLLVGGIGIMNIMLVSVTERIKEIGLRKALGATPLNIALQFLFESIMISVAGGSIGLFLGWGASRIAANFVRTEVPVWTAVLAIGFSVVVGVLFGTYPAIKASKKDPIEALRYE